MRRSSYLLIAAALVVVALPSQAKPAWLNNAKKAIPDATCATCHSKGKELNDTGKFAKANIKNGEPDYAAVAKHLKK